MCCAMPLVCPSIAKHHICQFWAHSESVKMPKTIVSRQMWSRPTCCNSIPLFRKSDEECCPQVLSSSITNPRPNTTAATKRLLQRFRWEVFDHPPSSVRTWLPVIFISFLIWNGRMRTTFWHNELQTSVENCLKAHAAGFYDEGIGKLVSRCEKCPFRSADYVEE